MIRVRDLAFRAGDFTVRDVSLDVAGGEYFVLLGPNGSGKTLLVTCLCGLIRAERGSIAIDGRDVPARKRRTILRVVEAPATIRPRMAP